VNGFLAILGEHGRDFITSSGLAPTTTSAYSDVCGVCGSSIPAVGNKPVAGHSTPMAE